MPSGTQRTITVGGNQVTINECPTAQSFRLIHDGSKVLNLYLGSGVVSTKNSLFYGTFSACLNESTRLGLTGVKPFVAEILRNRVRESVARAGEKFYVNLIAEMVDSATAVNNIATAIQAVRTRLGV